MPQPTCSPNSTQGGLTTVETGSGPYSVVVGDWNGDGNVDIATSNQLDSSVSVLVGCGDGTFAPRSDYRIGKGAYVMATCDLNGDRKADLVAANRDDNTIMELRNLGDGTFVTQSNFAGTHGWQALACADLNGDGLADVVLLGGQYSSVNVLLGTRAGNLAPNVEYPLGRTAFALAVADLNHDGNADVVTGNTSLTLVSVLLGKGDGTFTAPLEHTDRVGDVQTVAVADLNGDGRLDLGVGDQSGRGPLPHFGFMAGNGDGTFGSLIEDPSPPSISRVTIGDFNGDGRLDMVGLAYNSVETLFGQPGGGLLRGSSFKLGAQFSSFAAADLNSDGNSDLVLSASDPDHEIRLLFGQRDGTFR